ncbi:MAG: hypothetical protein RL685_6813 [Pseudomonadota bacterium]|jgi:hypothetical protein
MSSTRRTRSTSILVWLCLYWCVAGVRPAAAQSCPSSYASCDNDGCCPISAQCCPKLTDGCCDAATPFCCGDGTCAVSPAECGNIGRTSCSDYDIPCGGGCAPAGSQCCDVAGHYCPPQGVCMSETSCLSGDQPSAALLIVATPAAQQAAAPERTPSPLLNPPDGTDRSCALRPRGAAAPVPEWLGLVLLVGAGLLRRSRGLLRTRRAPR